MYGTRQYYNYYQARALTPRARALTPRVRDRPPKARTGARPAFDPTMQRPGCTSAMTGLIIPVRDAIARTLALRLKSPASGKGLVAWQATTCT